MKKSDLKSGMIIINRKGNKAIVLIDSDLGDVLGGGDTSNSTWQPLTNFNEDLTSTFFKTSDIMRIYKPCNNQVAGSFDFANLQLIWERKEEEILELTIDDIAEKFNVSPENIKIKK
jgi:hypothetical protein